jgi:hypothetical protein
MNGLDVQAAFDTIDAIKANARLARFQFRARNVWIDGGVNRSTIRDFYGAGREDDSRKADFVFTNGEPPVLLGNNEGANPVEFLLHALAGCVTTTFVLHAAARGITIQELSTELEGDLDVWGLLSLDSISPGYEQIVSNERQGGLFRQELDDLLAYTQALTVCNTVSAGPGQNRASEPQGVTRKTSEAPSSPTFGLGMLGADTVAGCQLVASASRGRLCHHSAPADNTSELQPSIVAALCRLFDLDLALPALGPWEDDFSTPF